MKYSIYQRAILNFIKVGVGNLVVSAVAGSGKTFTIIKALESIPTNKRVIFLAFNKSIATELKTRVPNYVHVYTLHGFGLNMIKKHLKVGKLNIDARKSTNYFRMESAQWDHIDESEIGDYTSRVRSLTNLGRYSMIKSAEELEEVANRHGIEITDDECDKAVQAIRDLSLDMTSIDFEDMVYIPAVFKKIHLSQ